MSEQEPRQDQPMFRLSFATGIELLCNYHNTEAYLHTEEPAGDHLYHKAEEPENSMYVFREQIPNFDEILEYMRKNNFDITQRNTLDEQDRKAFRKYRELAFKAQKKAEKQQQKMENPNPLTPRQERLVAFMGHLLEKEHLTAWDFEEGDGELYI